MAKRKKFNRKGYSRMVTGAEDAIKGVLTTVSAYFPTILIVRSGITGMKAVLGFIRGAA